MISGALRQHRFCILLVILTIMLLGSPLLLGLGLSARWFDILTAILMIAAISSFCWDRHQRLFAVLLGIPTIVLLCCGLALPVSAGHWVILLGHLGAIVFMTGAAILTIKFLFQSSALNLDSIFGALCGYLFLGLAWAACYSMMETTHPGSFAFHPSLLDPAGQPQPYVLTYFSFVTLTTVGYGDVSPITPMSRTLAWIEAISGQFYLAIIVAGLVSLFVANAAAKTSPETRENQPPRTTPAGPT